MRRIAIACLTSVAVVAVLVEGVPAANASTTKSGAVTAAKASTLRVPNASRFVTSARQVVVVSAARNRTSAARLQAFERRGGKWQRVMSVKARLGANGLVAGSKRRQGSMTTPTGIFGMTTSFGLMSNPGTSMPFTKLGADHYWVGDNASPFYNEMRLGSQGGFKRNASEHMVRYDPEYNYGVVIDFNRPNPVRNRGFAIFLHANGSGATAGCVSIGAKRMKALLRWLDPAKSPVIAIGNKSWLNR